MTALVIFPLCAILWLLICYRLGLVADETPGQGRHAAALRRTARG